MHSDKADYDPGLTSSNDPDPWSQEAAKALYITVLGWQERQCMLSDSVDIVHSV